MKIAEKPVHKTIKHFLLCIFSILLNDVDVSWKENFQIWEQSSRDSLHNKEVEPINPCPKLLNQYIGKVTTVTAL